MPVPRSQNVIPKQHKSLLTNYSSRIQKYRQDLEDREYLKNTKSLSSEMQECTFKPKINNPSRSPRHHKVEDRLMQAGKEYTANRSDTQKLLYSGNIKMKETAVTALSKERPSVSYEDKGYVFKPDIDRSDKSTTPRKIVN